MQHEGADASARAHAIFAVAHNLAFATCLALRYMHIVDFIVNWGDLQQ